jgi:intracellular septation protein
MKLFFDFLPGLLFLGALVVSDIYTATAVVMAAMAVQIAGMLVLRKKISGIQWFTAGSILVLGTATLVLHDANFIKWKPTVIYWIFGSLLLAGPPLLGKNFLRLLMEEHIKLPEDIWARLNWAWSALFFTLGGLNLVIAFNFSDKTWGFFKVFGTMGVIFVASVVQMLYTARFLPKEERSES